MWSKKNIAIIALGILLILALVLPLTNVLADPYKFFTGKDSQENQTTQQLDEAAPPSGNTEATQFNDNPSPVDAPANGQSVPAAQSSQPVQNTTQPVITSPPAQNTQPNTITQPGPGYNPGWDCAPMASVPPGYQPKYEWYDEDNGWGSRTRGHW